MEDASVELRPIQKISTGYSTTEVLGGFQWSDFYPKSIQTEKSSMLVEPIKIQNLFEFIQKNPAWKNEDRFLLNEAHPSRRAYYELFGDAFGFYQNGKMIGVFLGTILDWSTYYLRYTYIVESQRGTGLYQKFLEVFTEDLKNSLFERTEGIISCSNKRHLNIFLKLGFYIHSLEQSDRWGSTVRLTKYLKEKNEKIFLDQFCI